MMLTVKILSKRNIALLLMMVVIGLTGGVGFAQVTNPFPDNPSPFPYSHNQLGGTGGTTTGGQLVTFQGSMGSGTFFLQEFINFDADGGGPSTTQPTIHTILESASGDKVFLQESFVQMGQQRSPTTQNNTPSPVLAAPGHSNIAFRQSVKDTNFSSVTSLDPGQNIYIHDRVASPNPENGQIGGLSFANVDIVPNRTSTSAAGTTPTDQACGTTTVFCTTVDQQVRVLDAAGNVTFSQDADFVTGGTVTLVQGP